MSRYPRSRFRSGLFASLVCCVGVASHAAVLPNPTITAAGEGFNASFTADRALDSIANFPGDTEYATSGNAAGTPLSSDPNDGTWINFDFGSPQTIDGFLSITRMNNVDVIGSHRLIFSQDATFDAGDPVVTFASAGNSGAAPVESFAPQTAQFVRWEVVNSIGASPNLGSVEMRFLGSPAGQQRISGVTVVGAAPAFAANFSADNAADGDAGRNIAGGNEYAINGSITGATNAFVDFDLGSVQPITGFDFLDRPGTPDRVTGFDLIFALDAGFTQIVDVKSFSPGSTWGFSDSFAPVAARFVRYDITGAPFNANSGVSEMMFYAQVEATGIPTPSALPAGLALLGVMALRRRRGA